MKKNTSNSLIGEAIIFVDAQIWPCEDVPFEAGLFIHFTILSFTLTRSRGTLDNQCCRSLHITMSLLDSQNHPLQIAANLTQFLNFKHNFQNKIKMDQREKLERCIHFRQNCLFISMTG